MQNAIIGDDNSVTGGMIGAAALLLINYGVVRFLFTHERFERWVEGAADVLIEHGRIARPALRRNLITRPELEAAAHRQGFGSMAEVQRAVLEPSGTLTFVAVKPPPEAARHQELRARMDEILRELAALRAGLAGGGAR